MVWALGQRVSAKNKVINIESGTVIGYDHRDDSLCVAPDDEDTESLWVLAENCKPLPEEAPEKRFTKDEVLSTPGVYRNASGELLVTVGHGNPDITATLAAFDDGICFAKAHGVLDSKYFTRVNRPYSVRIVWKDE
jgi:hypothetical protein